MTTPDEPRQGPRRPPRREDPAARAAGAGPRRPPRPEARPARPARPTGRTNAPQTTTSSRTSANVAGLAEAGRSAPRSQSPREREVKRNRVLAGVGVLAVLVLLVSYCNNSDGGKATNTASKGGTDQPGTTSGDNGQTTKTTTGLAPKPAKVYNGWVDPATSGQPWSNKVVGQITFRGNPTRSYYGPGPVPKAPKIQWQYPETGGMCGNSPVGGKDKTWCGSGWTGQPSVWEQGGKTWLSVGAYDKQIHFWDAATGQSLLDDYDMGDIIKGSVTRDPDGFPLLYSGSRADFHILAIDRDNKVPESLWTLQATDVSPTKWNDDWDGSSLILDDYLFEGGENGQFHIVKLNRKMGADGKVAVDPKIVFNAPAWDDQLLSDLSGSGERVNDVSVENSVAISGNTVYFSNSGGLLQGWDITNLKKDPSSVKRSFRFWTGDDTDASVVIDKEGMLYVAQEVERSSSSARSKAVGQLIKLDPTKPDNPIVWSVADPNGMWATPAISDGVVVSPTDSGRIVGVDQKTGKILWEKKLPGPTWSSPVIVDKVWVQGDCSGVLHGFDFSNPRTEPPELWKVQLEGCVESTPTVFKGQIFVGARGGKFYALSDK